MHRHALARGGRAGERVAGADTALERGADQVGAQPALHVGTGPHAQQVQGHQLGGVLQAAARSAVTSPSIAAQIEPSTSSPARTAIATRCLVMPSAPRSDGFDDDRPVLAVEVAEDAALGERSGRTAPAPGGR